MVDGTTSKMQGYRVVQASWIRKRIENSQPVNYDNVIISGDLNLDGLNLPKEHISRTMEERVLGLSETLVAISSSIMIKNSTIEGNVDLQNAKFKNTVLFNNTEFTKSCDFEGSQFDQSIDFIKVKFNKVAEFSYIKFLDSSFVESQFNGMGSFEGSSFVGNVSFSSSCFKNDANFKESKFFRKANFDACQFEKNASYDLAEFFGDISFKYAQFVGDAYFTSAKYAKDIKLDFGWMKFNRLFINWNDIKNVLEYNNTAYLSLIKNFKDISKSEDANDCYYQYRKLSRKGDNILFEAADSLAQLFYGYGFKPQYPVAYLIVFLLLFGSIFAFDGSTSNSLNKYIVQETFENGNFTKTYISNENVSLPDYFIFSLNTLTSGVTSFISPDVEYKAKGFFKSLSIFEQLLGTLFVGLFIVAIGKTIIG
jgi:uncharacterized protein YjbI with pentapeptide repeats